jgi:hypothetical protein
MGLPIEFCSKRSVVAVLASGVVISLTALTGGVAPAFAKPGDDPSSPSTTVVVPAPQESAPEPEQAGPKRKPEAPQHVPQAPAPVEQAPATPAAPVVPAQPAAPEAPAAPVKPPSVQSPPKSQAPESPTLVEPEPQTQAPKPPSTAVAPPVTSVQPAEPSDDSEPTTARRAPRASEPTSVNPTPGSSAAPATTPAAPETSTDSTKPSAALAPGSATGQAPTSSGSEASTSESASRESRTEKSGGESDSETPTVSLTEAAKEIKTVEPQTVEAPEADVQLAKSAKPILEEPPAPAPKEDVAAFSSSIESSLKIPGLDVGAGTRNEFGVKRRDVELVSQVRQWRPEWVQYDEYYRPIFLNPYRDPVRIVYMYDRLPRIVIVPPLARMVIEAAQFAAYSFTAAVLAPINAAVDTVQALTNIAVGSFFGGGYFPGVGLPLPPPPPPVLRYDNVPVFVNYAQRAYEPFRVRQIVDVGDDAQFGERKVLLDGATPAWGQWTQTPTGERQFEIHRTQQFPGLDAPAEGPLPGDYKLRLLSDATPDTGFTGRDIFLFVAAGVIGTLGFGALGMVFYLGRRRPQH